MGCVIHSSAVQFPFVRLAGWSVAWPHVRTYRRVIWEANCHSNHCDGPLIFPDLPPSRPHSLLRFSSHTLVHYTLKSAPRHPQLVLHIVVLAPFLYKENKRTYITGVFIFPTPFSLHTHSVRLAWSIHFKKFPLICIFLHPHFNLPLQSDHHAPVINSREIAKGQVDQIRKYLL